VLSALHRSLRFFLQRYSRRDAQRNWRDIQDIER